MTNKKGGGRDAAKAKKRKRDPLTPEEEAEMATDIFLTEVEAELREDQLKQMWNQYGTWLFGAIAAIILTVAGYQFMQGQEAKRLAEQADAFARATELLADGNQDTAISALADVSLQGGAYGALAELQRAGVLLEQGDKASALEIFRAVSTSQNIGLVFNDVATLLWVIHGLDTENPDELQAALAPLTDPSNAHSYSALELMALLEVRRGQIEEAQAILTQLLEDANTPVGLRSRAVELSAVIGSPTGLSQGAASSGAASSETGPSGSTSDAEAESTPDSAPDSGNGADAP